jgi:hypothetical protein
MIMNVGDFVVNIEEEEEEEEDDNKNNGEKNY